MKYFPAKCLHLKEKAVSLHPLTENKRNDSLAQLVEHNTFNVGVLGSSPRRITKRKEFIFELLFLFLLH